MTPDQWHAPGLGLFQFSPIISGGPAWFTKPVLIALLPVASHIAFPIVLAVSVYGIKVYLGVRHHGVRGYLKGIVHLPGLPGWAYGLYAPLILAEVFINSLFTHFLRLFANMFAGHIIVAFFSSVGFWFLFEQLTPLGVGLGILGVVMTILMTALEMLIQFLQAFLFAVLASMFIASGLHGEH